MKTIIAACLFLGFSPGMNAQYTDTHFGIKAGLNVASLDVKNGVDFNSKAGLYVGGLAHVHLSSHFAVQPEVVYSTQGGTLQGDNWKVNYVNVPVLLQYMEGNGFRVETGPQLGIKASSKIESGDVEVVNHEVNTLDFSWAIGASYITAANLGIDARYNIGIANINAAAGDEIRNRVFQVGLFYQFLNPAPVHKK